MRYLIFIFLIFISLSFKTSAQTASAKRAMNFGRFYLDPAGGKVRIAETGGASTNVSGNATYIAGNRTGKITVKGTIGESLDFYFIDGTMSGPGGTITVDNIKATETSPMYFDVKRKNLFLGADATYPASLDVGTYVGTATFRYKYTTDTVWLSESFDLELEVKETPITITQQQMIDFGKLIADPVGGEISMDLSGNMSNTTGAGIFSGTSQPAIFLTEGHPNTIVDITLPNSKLLSNGTHNVRMINFSTDQSTFLPILLDSNGQLVFKIISDLDYGTNRSTGVYTGSYTIKVNY